ncbi:MAG: hypothetical protein OHK0045_09070 [Raineya sp.]
MSKFFLPIIFLFFVVSCEWLQGKKRLIEGKWQVVEVDVPGGEIAGEFLKSLVPGASILEKKGVLDFATNLLLKEAQEKILKLSFDFQADGKLNFSVASKKIDAAKWRYESAKEQIVLENSGVEIPLQIQEISKEKMVLTFMFKNQKMTLTLSPAKF